MDVMSRMIGTQGLLFIYALTGVLMWKIGILTTAHRGSYISLLINITLPCMILSSFDNVFELEQVKSAVWMAVISASVLALEGLLSLVLWRKQDDAKRSVLTFGTLFSNAGNAGLPVVSMVYGDLGVFYASIYLIPIRLTMWTLGIALYARDAKNRVSFTKILKNPSVTVVLVGFALMIFRVTLPQVIGSAVRNVGAMTTPLSMMIIGATLAEMGAKGMVGRQSVALSAVRLLLVPMLLFLLLAALRIDPLLVAVAVTLTAMPVAMNTAILAERYDADYRFATQCVFLSTVASLFTVSIFTCLVTWNEIIHNG